MMWALKVTRSTMAATRRGSGKTVPHSLKGRLVAMATEARSSRSVMIEFDEYCWRADALRETPAAVRFLSLEPLLGPLPSLDLTGID